MAPDRLSRRTYLALAGAGVAGFAGCGGSGGSEPTTAASTSTTTTASSTDEPTEAGEGTPSETAAPEGETTTASTDADVRAAEQSIAELSFEGSWFDTHAHWRMADAFRYDDYSTDDLTARQREHGVGATVLFVAPEPFMNDHGGSVQTLAREDVDYLPFFFPGVFDSAGSRRSYYEDNAEVFYGEGEVTFYSGRERGMTLTEEPFPQYFRLAAETDLVLMLHPTAEQAGDLGPMLSEYPGADLLLHGHELLSEGSLPDLLGEHENLHWTYDTATMLGGLMVTASGKSDFLERVEARRDRFLGRVTRRLPRLLEAAPDRVMWGTDVVADWHVDPEVYGELMSFSEDVLAGLPAAHRDAFAYENAVGLFGGEG